MEGTELMAGQEKPQKRVRFRVASGSSGRVLKEMFKDEGPSDSLDSDCTSSSDAERASTPSTTGEAHLFGPLGSELDECEGEPDTLLLYAGATKDWLFTTKRVNILSKNGTVRGVKHKVSAGQTLFENLPNSNCVSTAHQTYGFFIANTLMSQMSLRCFKAISHQLSSESCCSAGRLQRPDKATQQLMINDAFG